MKDKISKASGLKVLMEEYGIGEDQLIVYSGGENDIPMFDLASYSVAMMNASEFVKGKATRVTDYTNDENGLYRDLLVGVLSRIWCRGDRFLGTAEEPVPILCNQI